MKTKYILIFYIYLKDFLKEKHYLIISCLKLTTNSNKSCLIIQN